MNAQDNRNNSGRRGSLRKALFSAIALTAALWAGEADAASVRVSVEGLRSTAGQVLVAICPAETFDAGDCRLGKILRAQDAAAPVLFDDVAPGVYAVKVVHDENGNGRLDTDWLGIPTEGYGFSNDPPKNRRPTFDSSAFRVGSMPVTMPVTLFYR